MDVIFFSQSQNYVPDHSDLCIPGTQKKQMGIKIQSHNYPRCQMEHKANCAGSCNWKHQVKPVQTSFGTDTGKSEGTLSQPSHCSLDQRLVSASTESLASPAVTKENSSGVSTVPQSHTLISEPPVAKCSTVPFPRNQVIQEKDEVCDLQTAQSDIPVMVVLQM